MTGRIASLKADTREFMLNRYNPFMPLLLVYFLLEIAASVLPELFFSSEGLFNDIGLMGTSFILNVLFGLAGVGLIKAALDTLRGVPLTLNTLFYAFKNRSNRFILIQILFTVIKTALVLPMIPLNSYAATHRMTMFEYYGAYIGIQLFSLFVTMLLTIRLVWANYFMLDDIYLDAGPALKKSLAFSKGRTLEILYMKLSFIGMFFLAYCSMLLGFLYVRPYAEVTYANYYLANKE